MDDQETHVLGGDVSMTERNLWHALALQRKRYAAMPSSSDGRTVHVSRAGENLNQNRGGNTSWPLACKRRAYVGFASSTGTVVHIFVSALRQRKSTAFTSSVLLNCTYVYSTLDSSRARAYRQCVCIRRTCIIYQYM